MEVPTLTRAGGAREETRAREADRHGYATSPDGLRLYWELYGSGSTTMVLLPPNPISHSRIWKAQIHYLARHHRVVAYDGRGNGRSDSPDPSGMWPDEWWVSDCLTVMHSTDTDAAVLAGICSDGVWPSIQIAAAHPERVRGIVALAPGVPLLSPGHPWKAAAIETIDERRANPRGWEKLNNHYIRENHRDFLEFFFGEMFPEPHSTKQIEDAVAYGLGSPLDVFLMDVAWSIETREEIEEMCRRVHCPVLVLHGDRDNCQPPERGLRLAELTRGDHVVLHGCGHLPNARDPVRVNLLIHEFVSGLENRGSRRRSWTRAAARPRRALFVSSPIGLGHAWRDVAIARELRSLVADLEVQWLAQPPVTTLLEACGERVHPSSRDLAPEATHVDAETGEHELHAFQMLRRLDEIFCANFMVFHDVVEQTDFDVWIADEGWEVDYFLHENPECKNAPYVWLTDFVGIVPTPEGGEREAFLAADYNAQMIDHIARHPHVRDRAIYVGSPEDIVLERLGPDLPAIREWTEKHFEFTGYVTGFDLDELTDREALRAEFGYHPDEKICIVATGGSAAGIPLMQRSIAAFPAAKCLVPELRMIVVAGPRVDPRALPGGHGVEVCGYVHQLFRQLAACDLAITHGGLATTMELTATERPFLYFPLKLHFEQNVHVHHRLQRYRAGRRMNFDDSPASAIAEAIAEEIGRKVEYQPVETDGARRAAQRIAEML